MQIFIDCIKAFVVGGLLCIIGQILIDYTKLTPARILASYVVVGVLLTGFGAYQQIVDFAGAGATVPLTGFGYCLAKGVEKSIEDYGFVGIFVGGLSATSAGIAAAMLFGFIASLFCKSDEK